MKVELHQIEEDSKYAVSASFLGGSKLAFYSIFDTLRNQFKEELERVAPDLWNKAKGAEKGIALSEMKWVKEVISVLGRAEADHLRDIIFQQYRGHEDIERRQWSGLQSHLVNISFMLISFISSEGALVVVPLPFFHINSSST